MPLNCPLCCARIAEGEPTGSPGHAADHPARKWLEAHLRQDHNFYRAEAIRVTQDTLNRRARI